MRYCLVIVFLFLGLTLVSAQDTVMVLPESTVRPLQNDLRSTQQAIHTASLRSSSLSDLLFSEIGVNIRSNSAQGLSTLNFRGFGPEQTRVTWNGMPINSPMNGQIDLSLVPVFFLDQASMSSGDATGRFTTPTGGDLSLVSGTPSFSGRVGRSITSHLGAGSFRKLVLGEDMLLHTGNFVSRSRLFYTKATNNYPYYPYGQSHLPRERLSHARTEGFGLLQNFTAGKNSFSLWIQDMQRDLPPTLLEAASQKHQQDRHLRMVYNRKDSNSLGVLSTMAGLSAEELIYSDGVSDMYSENKSINGFASVQQDIYLKSRFTLSSALDGQWSTARTSNYSGIDPILILTLRHLVKWHKNRWMLKAGLRWTANRPQRIYTLPSVRALYRWSPKISTSLEYARGIRFPTTNHLYWSPGGNVNVGVETSDNLILTSVLLNKYFKTTFTVYGARMHDQIQWLPDESGLFRVTQQQGLESQNYGFSLQTNGHVSKDLKKNGIGLVWQANYHYTRSVRNTEDPGLQNIFIPLHQLSGKVGVRYSAFYLGWTQTFVSERYTTTTNDEWMEAWTLSDLIFSVQHRQWDVAVRLTNLFDQYYEMLPYRPMPMRAAVLNIQYRITSKNLKK